MSIREVVYFIQEARKSASEINTSGYRGEFFQRRLIDTLLPEAEKEAVSWWHHSKEQ